MFNKYCQYYEYCLINLIFIFKTKKYCRFLILISGWSLSFLFETYLFIYCSIYCCFIYIPIYKYILHVYINDSQIEWLVIKKDWHQLIDEWATICEDNVCFMVFWHLLINVEASFKGSKGEARLGGALKGWVCLEHQRNTLCIRLSS